MPTHDASFAVAAKRKRRAFTRCMVLATVGALACGVHGAAADTLDSLIAAGESFLSDAARRSRSAAIRDRAASGAVVFVPRPVSVPRLAADPALASGRRHGAIGYAEIAGNADLGVLMGPASASGSAGAAQRNVNWLTLWTRNPGDAWRVWLDAETVPGASDDDIGDIALERGPKHIPIPTDRAPGPGVLGYGSGIGIGIGIGGGGGGFGVGVGAGGPILSGKTQIDREMSHFTNTLLSTERSWMFDRQNKSTSKALSRYAAEDIRVLRDGQPVARGVLEAADAMGDRKGTYDMTQAAHRISSSYQLAASYGTVRFKAKGAARADTLAFAHVWRMDANGKYKMIANLETPIASRTAAQP